jgi:hypothetical protein
LPSAAAVAAPPSFLPAVSYASALAGASPSMAADEAPAADTDPNENESILIPSASDTALAARVPSLPLSSSARGSRRASMDTAELLLNMSGRDQSTARTSDSLVPGSIAQATTTQGHKYAELAALRSIISPAQLVSPHLDTSYVGEDESAAELNERPSEADASVPRSTPESASLQLDSSVEVDATLDDYTSPPSPTIDSSLLLTLANVSVSTQTQANTDQHPTALPAFATGSPLHRSFSQESGAAAVIAPRARNSIVVRSTSLGSAPGEVIGPATPGLAGQAAAMSIIPARLSLGPSALRPDITRIGSAC